MLSFSGKFEVPYFIYSVPNYSELKSKILDYILHDTNGIHSVENYENISKTDWYTTRDGNYFRQNFIEKSDNYYQSLKPYLDDIIQNIIPEKNKENFFVGNGWYHQYNKLNYYFWHDHPGNRWATIYYLELNDDCPKTEFINYYGPNIFPNVKEGDILVFPAWMKHRSPPNLSNNRKTILSFNIVEKPTAH